MLRFITKAFLILSFISTYIVLLIIITARLQLLNSNFWIQNLRSGNVYAKLQTPLMQSVENAFIEEGASKSEAKEIASVLEKSTLQEITENNINNFLNFINRGTTDLKIYYPLNKLPISVRQDLEINSNEISVEYLLSTFGRSSTPFGKEAFIQLQKLGDYLTITLVIVVISQLLTLFLIYKLEIPGQRLIAVSLSFILSGFLTLFLILLINIQISNMARDLTLPSQEPLQIVMWTITPTLVTGITNLWLIIALFTVLLGILCFLVKRPKKL